MIYTVTSLAWDPETRTLFYTTDNGAHRDLLALDPRHAPTRVLQKDARIGDLAFNQADKSLWGIRHLNGLCTIVRIPKPYRQWEQVATLPYGTVVYDLDVSPDGRYLSASFGEVTGQQDVRVFETEAMSESRPDPDHAVRLRSECAVRLRLLARWPLSLWQFVLHRRVEHLPLRPLVTDGTAPSATPMSDSSGRFPSTTTSCSSFAIPVRGLCRRSDGQAARGRQRHHVPGRAARGGASGIKTWNVGSPAAIPLDSMPQETAPYRIAKSIRRESFYPIVQGYKDTARSACGSTSRIRCSSIRRTSRWRGRPPASRPAEQVHLTPSTPVRLAWTGRMEQGGLLRSVWPHQDQP